MSSTGYWIIGTAAATTIERLRASLPAADFEPLPKDADTQWWQTMDHAELLAPPTPRYTYPGPSEAARRFAETLENLRPDPDERDTLLTVVEDTPRSEIFHVGVRKGDPVAALYYGLGYAAARLLPGRFGCFLLDADDVRASLATIEHLPEHPGLGNDALAGRAAAWLEAVSDEPGLEARTLLDGPLSVLRAAEARGVGALGLMQWF